MRARDSMRPPEMSFRAETSRADGPGVVISATILGLGGIRTHLAFLARLLRRHGSRVTLFATDVCWDDRLLNELQTLGVRLVLPPRRVRACRTLAIGYCGLVWPLVMPRGANSVYCIGAGRSHLLMQRLRPRGAVSINHEVVIPPGPASLAGVCAARLDATVANSRKVAEVMRSYWPEKRIRVIPFLTTDRPAPPPTRRERPVDAPLRVTYLGRLVEHKRPQELVRRWEDITSTGELRNARLEVYGFDPTAKLLGDLRGFVSSRQLGKRVRIHGEYGISDLAGIMAATDVVVLPSLDEGLPLVLVEAMSRGVPFVATAAGGTGELADGNPDVIVTPTEWEAFESGLRLMAGRLRREEIDPLRLHRWAEERYGYDTVSGRWLDCLRQPRRYFGIP
jgi:glycosyltransferase involved in cell wall biosynthesis